MCAKFRWLLVELVLVFAWTSASADPIVFWTSDPVRPGQTTMLIGDGLGDAPNIDLIRLDDPPPTTPLAAPNRWPEGGQKVPALQADNGAVKFEIPASLKPGIFAYRILSGGLAVSGLINKPVLWWIQGDLGKSASPGGWVRVFGKCLGSTGHGGKKVGFFLTGPKSRLIEAQADNFQASARVPEDLPVGDYRLYYHNGFGADWSWSEPIVVTIATPPRWPATVFNVRDFGASGTGVADDTSPIMRALEMAKKNGGGVVYFPRGRYQVVSELKIPRCTILRGEKREWVNLFWPDMAQPLPALISGTNSFGIEDLTLYASHHQHVIQADSGDKPGAGHVFLRRLRVRADSYRGHLKPEEVDERFRASLKSSTGGGDTLQLGGENIEISDCDLYGSGRALFLNRVKGGLVRNNTFYNGRWGWYCITGSDGLIFENNEVVGGDLMSTGGGLNCLYGAAYSQNIYYAHNRLRLFHGWDREAMTSDAGGEAYFGKIQKADGVHLVLADAPKWGKRDWTGAGVFILAGRGAGQYRRIVRTEGSSAVIDRPWAVPPDAESEISITMFHGHYILHDNDFTDTGAMQFYGTSIECIVAGNRGTRMQGFRGLGLWYHGYQPSWFCQFLENRIVEGNYYHWTSAADSLLEIFGAKRPPYSGPLNRGAVVRRNVLDNNASIRVAGTCRDVLVEGNTVKNSETGIFVSKSCENVLLRENTFQGVKQEVADEEVLRKAAEERMKKYLGRKEPVAAWDFETMAGTRFADVSGNGFHATLNGGVKIVEGGVRGRAAHFDGTGYLRVDEPAVFNLQDITVSLWVKPESLRGRRGLVSKRFVGAPAPLVFSQSGLALAFEAAEEYGSWTFNFVSPPVLKERVWTHLAVAARGGEGVTLYVNGQRVAEKKNKGVRVGNAEPLILGREAWGGEPPRGNTPGFFIGLMDEVKVWARCLTPGEVAADFQAQVVPKDEKK